jgi:site-specific DNA recombinase
VRRECDRAVNSLIKGMTPAEEIGPAITRLHEEKKALEAELSSMEAPANVVALHPGAINRYLAVVDDLATVLSHRLVDGNEEIAKALRELVISVTVTPAEKGPPRIEVKGRLAALTGADVFPHGRVVNALVAEEGFDPPTHGL